MALFKNRQVSWLGLAQAGVVILAELIAISLLVWFKAFLLVVTSAAGLLGLILLGGLVWLLTHGLIGLFQARSLVRREFMAYFLSPIAYVVLFVFLVVTGVLFTRTLNQLTADGPKGAEFPMQFMLNNTYFWIVFLFIPPLLTMRLLAEERGTGTLEMLMTAPIREWQVVLGKYVACLAFYFILWVPTLFYLPVLCDLHAPVFHPVWTPFSIMLLAGLGCLLAGLLLAVVPAGTPLRIVSLVLILAGIVAAGVGGWGHYHVDAAEPGTQVLVTIPTGIDPWPVVSTYLGFAFTGAMFLALGLFISSLVRSQMIAALVSLVLCLLFVAGIWVRPEADDPTSFLSRGLDYVTVPLHFTRDFSRGLIDTRHLTLYGSVAVFSLFLTVRSLESRRWR
jgi:hypothetical protein